MTEDQREYILQRYPSDDSGNLQAWDAAEEYLLDHIHNELEPSEDASILVVNDNFGALTLGLEGYKLTVWSDSYCAIKAIKGNIASNEIEKGGTKYLHVLDECDGRFDLIVVKVPKSLSLPEYQLKEIRPLANPETLFLAGGMTKTIHNSTLKIFENIIGTTKTSLAVKKARLIISELDQKDALAESDEKSFSFQQRSYTTKPGVFSLGKLDRGTDHLLTNLLSDSELPDPMGHVVDLGCGCGILGIEVGLKYPDAKLTFVDDSYLAIESARENADKWIPKTDSNFIHGDCLESMDSNSVDLIICNPPFHQNNSVTIGTAERMFLDSKRVLKEAGKLVVVGNKHLGYHKRLEKIFGKMVLLFSDQSYVVISCRKEI